jgi:hypothetical protein
MSWLSHRNNITAISIILAIFLLGLPKAFGLNVTVDTLILGIPIAYFLSVGAGYIAWAIIKRYI